MEHLQLAYDLAVIITGFVALSMAAFWASKTRDTDLSNFCILYATFCLVLVLEMLKKYLSINVQGYSSRSWYLITGVYQVFTYAVIFTVINFLLGVYQVRARKAITLFFLLTMLIGDVIIFTPFGTILDPLQNIIHLETGYRIVTICYLLSFTFAMVMGYGLLGRVWNTDKRFFMLGLLIFATTGYLESLFSIWAVLHMPIAHMAKEDDFLYSSIPFALYGIFLISYFLNYTPLAPLGMDELSSEFLSRYGITGREREIILKVIQGKSNGDIASELVISLATVKTHLHNVYQKIGVDSRFDLLAKIRSGQ